MTDPTHSHDTRGPRFRYTASLASDIEARWQAEWDRRAAFKVANPGDADFDASRPKFYCLDMFPYPSGAGLHVGHPEGYTATDIICRFRRMKGFNVLHPMGWDAFGLPAEQYAIQTNVHPAITTRKAIETFRRQLKRFGFSYDWSREFATIDPDYYRWTQWIFLRLYNAWYDRALDRARPINELIEDFKSGKRPFELNPDAAEYQGPASARPAVRARNWTNADRAERHLVLSSWRLAYLAEVTVNWCPKLGTALANEEVIDGRSERGGFPVFRKPLRQWMFRITAYAERLLRDLEGLDWPTSTRTMQEEWIGRSEGAYIDFPAGTRRVRVFTTRPDTVFGATFMVLAPEHPMIDTLAGDKYGDTISAVWKGRFPGSEELIARGASPKEMIAAYRAYASSKSDVDRQTEGKDKTGVFTGAYAINPANNARIPIFIADYVLMGYGTGAIMAVPAQDTRDWEFAEAFGLPIVRTVKPPDDFPDKPYLGDGPAMNSAFLDGLSVVDAKAKIIDWLETNKFGRRRVNYRLRDWLFSRQRYWGEPFPIAYDEAGLHYGLRGNALPLTLPELADFTPEESDDPRPLLGKAKEWSRSTVGESALDDQLEAGPLNPAAAVTRELNTMPNWAGSCWYYFRYCSPRDASRFVSRDAERYWMTGSVGGTGVPPVRPEGPRCVTGWHRTRRNLPHWELAGSTYFVTFRSEIGVLSENERRIVLDACCHWHGARARVWLVIVMHDHVHMLIDPREHTPGSYYSLSDLLHSIKSFSAHEIRKHRGGSGPVWQAESFDRIVRREDEFREKWNYMLNNPVTAGLVKETEQYEFIASPQSNQPVEIRPDRPSGDHRRDACATGEFGGVDLYVGGAEHAVLHLLYARFWHKVLFDLGEVSTIEPFRKLFHQGLITSYAYQRPDKTLVPSDEVEERAEGEFIEKKTGAKLAQVVAKMSKSLKNVVNPDDVIAEFGADTFRLYEMYMGPLDASKPWNPRDISGLFRFLQRLWRVAIDEEAGSLRTAPAPDPKLERELHKLIHSVEQKIDTLSFNTAIAELIKFVNDATSGGGGAGGTQGAPALTTDQLARVALVICPFAPHIAEELWAKLGKEGLASEQVWPAHDPAMLVESEIELPVQIAGKVRARLMVPADADPAAIERLALADDKVKAAIEGKTVQKVIVVPGRMVNIVAK